MARNNQDVCVICEEHPCACGRVTQPRTRAPKTQSAPKTEPRSALEAMAADARRYMPSRPAPQAPSGKMSDEDREFVDGIKVVQRMLGATFVDPDDERAMKAALDEPDSISLRILSWRHRKEERQRGSQY